MASTQGPLPTLQLVDLACRRGERLLFSGVQLEVPAARIVWLRGRNGCGKTSLLRMATGLAPAEQGRVLWGGEPVRGNASYRAALLYVAHANALKDDLTIAESLAFLARIHGRVCSEDALRSALQTFGLAGRWRAPVRTLSQGQRRRVALARLALQTQPGLWMLDEPYDALDAEGSRQLDELLVKHRERGGSVLLTSHQPLAAATLQPQAFDLDRHAG